MNNFDEAIEHLNVCSEAYTEVGSPGMFVMVYVITPLRDRVNNGERSQELYDEIMEIQL